MKINVSDLKDLEYMSLKFDGIRIQVEVADNGESIVISKVKNVIDAKKNESLSDVFKDIQKEYSIVPKSESAKTPSFYSKEEFKQICDIAQDYAKKMRPIVETKKKQENNSFFNKKNKYEK